jgi:hypothetical protein
VLLYLPSGGESQLKHKLQNLLFFCINSLFPPHQRSASWGQFIYWLT